MSGLSKVQGSGSASDIQMLREFRAYVLVPNRGNAFNKILCSVIDDMSCSHRISFLKNRVVSDQQLIQG